jgi:hypothetical protein
LSVGLLFTLGNQFGRGRQGGGGGVSLVRRDVGGAGIAWSTATTIPESSTNWLDRIDLDFNQIRHPTFFSTSFPSQVSPSLDNSSLATTGSISKRSVYPLDVSFASPTATSTSVSSSAIQNSIDRDQDGEEGGERPTGPDWERIIGRMSAWLCTTLYLTSRLPQIWRNVSISPLSLALSLALKIADDESSRFDEYTVPTSISRRLGDDFILFRLHWQLFIRRFNINEPFS